MKYNSRQCDIDAANSEFWSELCGSAAAKDLGITGNDPQSLQKFDDWFFEFYPYLDRYIDFPGASGKRVLEVGLGYGSVSQRLAASGAIYTGLDIAAGPVSGVNHRLNANGLKGAAQVGSILAAPFPDRSFDVVVAIGCYHHTGNLERAIEETARILRPKGRATIMVYNATNYIQWYAHPERTFRYMKAAAGGEAEPLLLDSGTSRGAYDRNTAGDAAPETVVISKPHFQRMLAKYFPTVQVESTNIGDHGPLKFISRNLRLKLFGPTLGLDLYARVKK